MSMVSSAMRTFPDDHKIVQNVSEISSNIDLDKPGKTAS